ncbi:hypothetical protein BpHYR1_019965 [Brachionus plicatilis]|uniref:Uncharacterized protein n=1 Tax=Brachionus plicatilis TaxID=10195 RepID=A0A3M7PKA6_BRAPC|nr:hypothetical protein BpHYR1_019965 [Brachionus plicatilis]
MSCSSFKMFIQLLQAQAGLRRRLTKEAVYSSYFTLVIGNRLVCGCLRILDIFQITDSNHIRHLKCFILRYKDKIILKEKNMMLILYERIGINLSLNYSIDFHQNISVISVKN